MFYNREETYTILDDLVGWEESDWIMYRKDMSINDISNHIIDLVWELKRVPLLKYHVENYVDRELSLYDLV